MTPLTLSHSSPPFLRHSRALIMGRKPCCDKAHTNRGVWTKEEDDRLLEYIRLHGHGSWRSLPKAAGLLRCGKSCRLRWINYLRPDVKRGNFTSEEDELIIKLHKLHGNKWSTIARRLPGRTDNEIKNHWNSHIRRNLLGGGIDPTTRRPTRRPITTREGNSSSTLTASATNDAEKTPKIPGGEEDNRKIELTLDLFPTHAESIAEWKLRPTTTPNGVDEDAGVCVDCCQLRSEDSNDCQKHHNQSVELTL